MHELSVTENILEIVMRHARQAKARRVVRIHLVIGDLSSLIDDCIQFYFDFLAHDTIAAQAQLEFKRVAVKLHCPQCARTWQPNSADWTCPGCGQAQASIQAGREFYVDSIEVE